MSNELKFEYEGMEVSGTEIHNDELTFDKSLVASFEVMSAEEQAKIVTAWGAAGIKTRIEEGQLGSIKNA